MAELRTSRLVLRQWAESDSEPFAELNTDPEVMRYFPASLTREQSLRAAEREHDRIEQTGWGLWAVELVGEAPFIGFVGLAVPQLRRISRRPSRSAGGSARPLGARACIEGARAAVAYGFDELGLEEIVSLTAAVNQRSRRVMERLGMRHDDSDDFDHPSLSSGSLRRHVLYRLRRIASTER